MTKKTIKQTIAFYDKIIELELENDIAWKRTFIIYDTDMEETIDEFDTRIKDYDKKYYVSTELLNSLAF